MKLAIADIKATVKTQMRVELNMGVAREYAEAMEQAVSFPPMVVFHDGADYWLADGFHRIEAYKLANITHVEADVRQGTLRDAVLYACGCNSTHGLRRTNADRKQAVTTLLDDDEWSQWSDHKIAKQCAVSPPTVAKYRKLSRKVLQIVKAERNGKTYPLNTGKLRVQDKPVIPVAVSPEVAQINDEHGGGLLDVATLGLLTEQQQSGNETFGEVMTTGYIQPGEEIESAHVTAGATTLRKAIATKHRDHRQQNPSAILKIDTTAPLEDIARAIAFAMPDGYKELGRLLCEGRF